METVMSNEAVVVSVAVSAYEIMLMKLSQFQALGCQTALPDQAPIQQTIANTPASTSA